MKKPKTCGTCIHHKVPRWFPLEDQPTGRLCAVMDSFVLWPMREPLPEWANCPLPEGAESRGERAVVVVMEGGDA